MARAARGGNGGRVGTLATDKQTNKQTDAPSSNSKLDKRFSLALLRERALHLKRSEGRV